LSYKVEFLEQLFIDAKLIDLALTNTIFYGTNCRHNL